MGSCVVGGSRLRPPGRRAPEWRPGPEVVPLRGGFVRGLLLAGRTIPSFGSAHRGGGGGGGGGGGVVGLAVVVEGGWRAAGGVRVRWVQSAVVCGRPTRGGRGGRSCGPGGAYGPVCRRVGAQCRPFGRL